MVSLSSLSKWSSVFCYDVIVLLLKFSEMLLLYDKFVPQTARIECNQPCPCNAIELEIIMIQIIIAEKYLAEIMESTLNWEWF